MPHPLCVEACCQTSSSIGPKNNWSKETPVSASLTAGANKNSSVVYFLPFISQSLSNGKFLINYFFHRTYYRLPIDDPCYINICLFILRLSQKVKLSTLARFRPSTFKIMFTHRNLMSFSTLRSMYWFHQLLKLCSLLHFLSIFHSSN